tara:strand:+ start:16 stop:717 length:702 start_codon:yes stop_codon:yes gene_type:complete
MKNDMKLIMESFRKSTLQENANLKNLGAKMEDDLEDIFDDALKQLKNKVDKELNEELITIATILYTLWVSVMGAAGLGSLLAKASKFVMDNTTAGIDGTSGLERADKIFEGVFESVATFGTKPITKYIVKKASEPGNESANLDKVDKIYKIAAVVIGIAASGFEIVKAANEAGGVANYISDLFAKVGLKDAEAIKATTEAFSTSVGTGADTFEVLKFANAARTSIGNYIRTNI